MKDTGIKVNPDYWGVRCNHCGETFTYGQMLKKYKDRQKDAPPGMYYVKCPGCGTEDFLTKPDQFILQQTLKRKRRLH